MHPLTDDDAMIRQPKGFKDANFFTHSFLIPVLHERRVMDGGDEEEISACITLL